MNKLENRKSSLLAISLAVLLVFTLGLTLQAEDQTDGQESVEDLSVLIVDQTGSFSTSMQTELLARNLGKQLSAEVQARKEIPEKANEGKRFGVIFIIPKKVLQVWVLTGLVPYKVPEEKRKALTGVQKIANKVYSQADFPKREVVGIIDDLAPAAYASYLKGYGWLGGPGG
ncbi:hypothetical protein KGY71_01945 [Candidatus Bipolaricaulota bacterium]|nr:hypothetical protein [Candidatus Bipolaricaulota bacterium]